MEDKDYPSIYQAADKVSIRAQRSYLLITRLNLLFLILGASLAIYSFNDESWKLCLRTISFCSLLFSFSMTILIKTKKYEDVWYQGRALAESVKTLTWRYITCSELFEITLSDQDVDKRFKKRLEELKNEFKNLIGIMDADLLDLPFISNEMRVNRKLGIDQRRDYYIEKRIVNQKKWYTKKAKYNGEQYDLWFSIILIAQGLAMFSVVVLIKFPLSNWNLAALFTTIASASISWLQIKQHQELKQAYTITAQELHFIESDSTSVKTEQELSKFVLDSENAISREHTLWLAQKRK